MLLTEQIEDINRLLSRDYGYEYGVPRFRVVFSEDQYEKRWTDYTDDGFELLTPEVRLLPKYKQWIKEKYILERLVPRGPESDLVEKMTYEPAWVFEDTNGNYLPPVYDACKLVIEALMHQITHAGNFTKYKDKNESKEERELKLQKVQQDLFGNETPTTDALAYGYGVTNPGINSGKETVN